MSAHRDEAIVLSRAPLRERDLLVVLLTRSAGVQRAVARRARGGRGRLGAILEPLNRCRVKLFRPQQRDLASLDDAALVRSGFALVRRPAAWAAGQVLAELATLYCPEGQRSEELFRLVDHCLEFLVQGGNPESAVGYSQLWFLRLTGVLPDLGRCGQCGEPLGQGPWGWEDRTGQLTCSRHAASGAGGKLLPVGATAWLQQASRARAEHLSGPPPPAATAWLGALSDEFTERPLRSWEFFRQALAAERAGAPGAPTPRPPEEVV